MVTFRSDCRGVRNLGTNIRMTFLFFTAVFIHTRHNGLNLISSNAVMVDVRQRESVTC